ncbi:hypothetical protein [Caldisericum exile]|nr:hypothetical protein [Caldisericum exile]
MYCLFLIFVLPSLICAEQAQPYVGGYFNNSFTTTNKVIASISYQSTNPQLIGTNTWLGGVISVAGATGTGNTQTGCIFQNGVALYNNGSTTGNINWAPQWWKIDGTYQIGQSNNIASVSYPAFYERMEVSGSNIIYKLYAYPNLSALQYDAPVIYSWSSSAFSSTTFLVGTSTVYINQIPVTFKHFQFGVESPNVVNNTNWRALISKVGYYATGGWKFQPAETCLGNGALITYVINGQTLYYTKVGSLDYTGANIDTSSTYNDSVDWEWSGTTITPDTYLWYGSGSVSDSVSKPYN